MKITTGGRSKNIKKEKKYKLQLIIYVRSGFKDDQALAVVSTTLSGATRFGEGEGSRRQPIELKRSKKLDAKNCRRIKMFFPFIFSLSSRADMAHQFDDDDGY